MSVVNKRAEEAYALDHLPTCACGDIGAVGEERCAGCGASLFPRGLKPPRALAAIAGDRRAEDPMERWWRERHTASELRALSGWAA